MECYGAFANLYYRAISNFTQLENRRYGQCERIRKEIGGPGKRMDGRSVRQSTRLRRSAGERMSVRATIGAFCRQRTRARTDARSL